MAKVVHLPDEFVAQARNAPLWKAQEALDHTLAYDATIMGDHEVPAERVASVTTPTLVLTGGASPPWLHDTARAMVGLLPEGGTGSWRGQEHNVTPEAIAPALAEFFAG